MILAAWVFWEPVFTDTPIELFGSIAVVAILAGGYRHLCCHQSGCYRLGRFPHGHLRLCRAHHPLVPSGGKITQTHIDAETQRKA